MIRFLADEDFNGRNLAAPPNSFYSHRADSMPGNEAGRKTLPRLMKTGLVTGNHMWRGGDTGHSDRGRPCRSKTSLYQGGDINALVPILTGLLKLPYALKSSNQYHLDEWLIQTPRIDLGAARKRQSIAHRGSSLVNLFHHNQRQ